MTESLRARCIETSARQAYEADVAQMVDAAAPKLMLLPGWDELTDNDREHRRRRSASHLDAMLACLTENAVEKGYCSVHDSRQTGERCEYALWKGYDGPPNDCGPTDVYVVDVAVLSEPTERN